MVCLIFFFTHYCPDACASTNSEVTRYEIPYLTRAQIPPQGEGRRQVPSEARQRKAAELCCSAQDA